VLGLAACGSSKETKPPPQQKQETSTTKVCRSTAKTIAKLQADIAAMRAAARTPTKDRLQGNHAINAATDRFLNDVSTAPIGNLRRNRLIDHAAGTLSGACEQCFQALEAARPIPAIRLGQKGC